MRTAVLLLALALLAAAFLWGPRSGSADDVARASDAAPLPGRSAVLDPVQVDAQRDVEPDPGVRISLPAAPPIADAPVERSARVRFVGRDGAPVERDSSELGELELFGPTGAHRIDDARVDDDGMFVLSFGPAPASHGYVTLEHDFDEAFFVDPTQPHARTDVVPLRTAVRLAPGDLLDLVVAPGGTVLGRLVQPEPPAFPVDRIRVRSMAAPTPYLVWEEGQGPVAWGEVDESGRFGATGIDAGSARVEFLDGGGSVALAIDDVEVRLGEVAQDPRLALVDLRATTRTLHFEVVDARGGVVSEPSALALVGPDPRWAFGEDGRLSIALPRHELEAPVGEARITFTAEGYAPRSLRAPWVEGTVVLEPQVPVRAAPSRAYESDIGSHGFWLRLRPETIDVDAGDAGIRSVELPFEWGQSEGVEVASPGPGRYEVDVLVRMRMGSMFGSMAGERWQATGASVLVSGASSVVVPVPADLTTFVQGANTAPR